MGEMSLCLLASWVLGLQTAWPPRRDACQPQGPSDYLQNQSPSTEELLCIVQNNCSVALLPALSWCRS